MQKLLQIFEYIKRYHSDIFDSLALLLQFLIIHNEQPKLMQEYLKSHQKHKNFRSLYEEQARAMFAHELYTHANPKLNLGKIFKVIASTELHLDTLEQFIHTITIKRTLNKLYIYSTPKEINELIVSLLQITPNDEIYNPCYGMGTLFLTLSRHAKTIHLFGEELNERLAKIAKLMARLSGIKEASLAVNDILKKPLFKGNAGFRKFDKILCNPPFSAHLGIQYLKSDERFSKYGILAKSSPELVFLTHALMHLGHKGVFIIRNQTLQKSFLEEKLRERMIEERMIEAIIELPKNIFPHQNHDFSILIITPQSDAILHIDASKEHFWKKDGKYRRLVNVEEILALYRNRSDSQYSKLTNIQEIDIHDLRASRYVRPLSHSNGYFSLGALKPRIFRGQRVYGSAKDEKIEFIVFGICDFAPYCLSIHGGTQREKGDSKKIKEYALRPYDLLIPLRGNSPKITILGEHVEHRPILANTGIVVVRLQSKEQAIALYLYLFSKEGQEELAKLYASCANTLSPKALLELRIPINFEENTQSRFAKLSKLAHSISLLKEEIEALR